MSAISSPASPAGSLAVPARELLLDRPCSPAHRAQPLAKRPVSAPSLTNPAITVRIDRARARRGRARGVPGPPPAPHARGSSAALRAPEGPTSYRPRRSSMSSPKSPTSRPRRRYSRPSRAASPRDVHVARPPPVRACPPPCADQAGPQPVLQRLAESEIRSQRQRSNDLDQPGRGPPPPAHRGASSTPDPMHVTWTDGVRRAVGSSPDDGADRS